MCGCSGCLFADRDVCAQSDSFRLKSTLQMWREAWVHLRLIQSATQLCVWSGFFYTLTYKKAWGEGEGVCVQCWVPPSSFLPGKTLLSLLALPVMPSRSPLICTTGYWRQSGMVSWTPHFQQGQGRLRHNSHPTVNYSLITYLFLPLVSLRMVGMCIYSSLINVRTQRYHINTHILFP